MQTKLLGVLSLICLIVTILWLVFLIVDMSVAGPLETFEKVLTQISKPSKQGDGSLVCEDK